MKMEQLEEVDPSSVKKVDTACTVDQKIEKKEGKKKKYNDKKGRQEILHRIPKRKWKKSLRIGSMDGYGYQKLKGGGIKEKIHIKVIKEGNKNGIRNKLYEHWEEETWHSGVEWLTGVDIFNFMIKHEEWYPDFVPILGIQVLAGQMAQMENDIVLGKRIYRHPSLLILNSGNHWIVGNITSHSRKEITLWDSFAEGQKISTVIGLMSTLQTLGWQVERVGLGTQTTGDSNTCGYNVLMFVKQLLEDNEIKRTGDQGNSN